MPGGNTDGGGAAYRENGSGISPDAGAVSPETTGHMRNLVRACPPEDRTGSFPGFLEQNVRNGAEGLRKALGDRDGVGV